VFDITTNLRKSSSYDINILDHINALSFKIQKISKVLNKKYEIFLNNLKLLSPFFCTAEIHFELYIFISENKAMMAYMISFEKFFSIQFFFLYSFIAFFTILQRAKNSQN